MLTPPGMGGKYRITGNRYPRMRRQRSRRRIVLSSGTAVLAVTVIGWGTVQLIDVFTGGSSSAQADARQPVCSTPSPTAAVEAEVLPDPETITVNVYNATTRSGLAQQTADQLAGRGFEIGEIANAPAELDKKVKATGLLVGSPGSYEKNRLTVLGTHVADAETRTDDRRGRDVDLVIGDKFTRLEPEQSAARALAALASPSPVASPSCTPR